MRSIKGTKTVQMNCIFFLDGKQNALSTSEEAVAWGDNLKEIVNSYNITALLGIIDSATNAMLESSNIAKDYRAV